MEYPDFTTHDFIEDARFRQWVRQPDARLDAFWQNFLEKHPEKTPEVIAATNFLLGIEQQVEGGTPTATATHEEEVFQRIKQTIAEETERSRWQQLPAWTVWVAAASVLLLLGYFILPFGASPSQEISYETNRKHATLVLTEKVNDTAEPISITLSDGSFISLKPNSRASYAADFSAGSRREVYLSGEAFFEVAKDPNKPFFVYANELVTKVLGTSFNVRAYQDDEDVTVEVRSGRVSVAVADQMSKEVSPREREGILLLPNQQAVLARREIRLVKTLVEHPILLSEIAPGLPHFSFVFTAASAPKVFETLERAYGLDIVFDEETFAHCQFTSDLTDVPPYEKLDIVCRSIEATYRILDAQIIIDGKGCKP